MLLHSASTKINGTYHVFRWCRGHPSSRGHVFLLQALTVSHRDCCAGIGNPTNNYAQPCLQVPWSWYEMLSPAHGQCMHLLSTVPTKQATPHNGNGCECLLLSREDTGHSLVRLVNHCLSTQLFHYHVVDQLYSWSISIPPPPVVQLGRPRQGCHKADCKWFIALYNLRLNCIEICVHTESILLLIINLPLFIQNNTTLCHLKVVLFYAPPDQPSTSNVLALCVVVLTTSGDP